MCTRISQGDELTVTSTPTLDLPLQYQAVDGASATKSGIKILPFMMSAVVCSIISGAITGITGEYWYASFR